MELQHLYAPWRSLYTRSISKTQREDSTHKECIFCEKFADTNDREHFILRRFAYTTVVLNLYPYTPGHLMVIPNAHISKIHELEPAAQTELIYLTGQAARIFEEHVKAPGVNIGMNMGTAGGAGIPAHLHMHVMPRWIGDTNFITTVGHTRVISVDLNGIYDDLKEAFQRVPAISLSSK